MGGLILGINTLYRLFCFFKLFLMIGKGLTEVQRYHILDTGMRLKYVWDGIVFAINLGIYMYMYSGSFPLIDNHNTAAW